MKKTILLYIAFCFCPFVFSQERYDSSNQDKANSYLEKLQTAYVNGNYKNHKLYSDSLLSVAKEHNLYRMQVLALNNQAIFHNSTSERETSIRLYHEALKICELIPDDFKAKAVVLVNMGNTYNNIGEYDKAIEAMKKVIKVADNAEDSHKVKAAALIGLANNYTRLKEYHKALEYSYKAKELGDEANDELTIVSSVNNISDAYINLKKYQEVLDISDSISQIPFLKQPTKIKAEYILNTGIANYYLKHTDIALKQLNESKLLVKNKNLLEIEMDVYEYLAKAYEQKENFEASYSAQKKYSSLKEDFLNDKKNAASIDLKEDISTKEMQIDNLSTKRNQILIGSLLTILALSILLFFYIKRKKVIELEQAQLRTQYQNLQQTINTIKHNKINKVVDEKNSIKPYKNSSLTQSDRENFKANILSYMEKEKPYLDADLKQTDLASKMGMSTHNFSEVLNYAFGQNFYNFINSYRVITAQQLIKDTKYKDAKMIAVAFDSGFKSKTSFNRVFKKHTGLTPSEYRTKLV